MTMDYTTHNFIRSQCHLPMPNINNCLPVHAHGTARIHSEPKFHGMDKVDMKFQLRCLEKEAYRTVLMAFSAQSDAISWDKEGLITELRKELNVTDTEHRELLLNINSDETVRMIRDQQKGNPNTQESHSGGVNTPGFLPNSVGNGMHKKLKASHAAVPTSQKYASHGEPYSAAPTSQKFASPWESCPAPPTSRKYISPCEPYSAAPTSQKFASHRECYPAPPTSRKYSSPCEPRSAAPTSQKYASHGESYPAAPTSQKYTSPCEPYSAAPTSQKFASHRESYPAPPTSQKYTSPCEPYSAAPTSQKYASHGESYPAAPTSLEYTSHGKPYPAAPKSQKYASQGEIYAATPTSQKYASHGEPYSAGPTSQKYVAHGEPYSAAIPSPLSAECSRVYQQSGKLILSMGKAVKSMGNVQVSSVSKGRQAVKSHPNDFHAPGDGNFSERSGLIQIRETDKLLYEVERMVYSGEYSDPVLVEKAKLILKGHERSLLDLLAKLSNVSDGDDSPNQMRHYLLK